MTLDLELEDVVFGADKRISQNLRSNGPVCHGSCAGARHGADYLFSVRWHGFNPACDPVDVRPDALLFGLPHGAGTER